MPLQVVVVVVFNTIFQHTIGYTNMARINGGGRTLENPWKESPTHEKLIASFLIYRHWPNLRLEP
jgi:hypothetical protein